MAEEWELKVLKKKKLLCKDVMEELRGKMAKGSR